MSIITKERLIAARKLIEDGRLIKGDLSSWDGKGFCTIGAYFKVVRDETPSGVVPQSDSVYQFFNAFVPNGNIVRYNDSLETTKEDILKIYDLAIDSFGNNNEK